MQTRIRVSKGQKASVIVVGTFRRAYKSRHREAVTFELTGMETPKVCRFDAYQILIIDIIHVIGSQLLSASNPCCLTLFQLSPLPSPPSLGLSKTSFPECSSISQKSLLPMIPLHPVLLAITLAFYPVYCTTSALQVPPHGWYASPVHAMLHCELAAACEGTASAHQHCELYSVPLIV